MCVEVYVCARVCGSVCVCVRARVCVRLCMCAFVYVSWSMGAISDNQANYRWPFKRIM